MLGRSAAARALAALANQALAPARARIALERPVDLDAVAVGAGLAAPARLTEYADRTGVPQARIEAR